MFAFRTFLALAFASAALANPLEARQATNTNARISDIIDSVDIAVHHQIPNICKAMT